MFLNKHRPILLINLWLLKVAYCQKIELYEYNKTEKCNMSLVKEMGRVVMYGKVDFNGNIPASSIVNLEIRRKKEPFFQFLSFVKVPEDCNNVVDQYCSCYKTDDPKVFRLLLNITAHPVNSEAHIRAELVYREISFFSEIRNFPTVHESQTEAVVVYANEQYVCQTCSNVTINETQVTIFSTCLEKFTLQCELQLSNLRTESLVKSGKKTVVYTGNLKGIESFDLKYNICNIQGNISFSITTEDKVVDIHSNSGFTILEKTLITLVILASLMALFFLHLLLRNSISLREFNKEVSEPLLKNNTSESVVNKQNVDSRRTVTKSPVCNLQTDSNEKKWTVDFTEIPIRYRDEFHKLLKVLAQLTCRINLKRKSFSTQSSNVGCGLVTGVLKYVSGVGVNTVKDSQSRVCSCPKCLKSKSPSNTWAEFIITTSSAIMKNKNYHKQITFVLSTEDKVTTELRDLNVEHKDAKKSGRCVLKYLTCDQSFINKLQTLLDKRSRLEERIQEIFHQDKDHDKIYFAFAFREDDTKHICTGKWSEEKTKFDVRTYHYNPAIPHGMIGAPVVLMGYSNKDNEYSHMRDSFGQISPTNLSTAVFTIETVQKVKNQ